MAVLMSVVFCVPTFYLCSVGGSFFVWWLVYLVSLSDGICARFTSLHTLHTLCHLAAAHWGSSYHGVFHALVIVVLWQVSSTCS